MKAFFRKFKAVLNEIRFKLASLGGSSSYWSTYMVDNKPFESVKQSLDHYNWRNSVYPGYIELMPVDQADGLIVLDYGCGPGNDLIGFGHFSSPKKLIGADVSSPAMKIAKKRTELHGLNVEFIKINENSNQIPQESESIDLVHSSGVLHHAKDIDLALKEIYRILKPGGSFQVMVYNHSSIWLHLYTAYINQIENKKYAKLPLEDAFRKLTDGSFVPISKCYRPEEFESLVKSYGFKGAFKGASISTTELKIQSKIYEAIENQNLAKEHRDFLSNLEFNEKNHPMYKGDVAGINACFHFIK